jgi:hypothetical protein
MASICSTAGMAAMLSISRHDSVVCVNPKSRMYASDCNNKQHCVSAPRLHCVGTRLASERTVPTPISMAYITTIMARMLLGADSAIYTGPTMDARPMATPMMLRPSISWRGVCATPILRAAIAKIRSDRMMADRLRRCRRPAASARSHARGVVRWVRVRARARAVRSSR